MWQKYNSSKLLTSIESTSVPLSDFDFPSVTVCSQNRFSKSKLNRLRTENNGINQLTDDDLELVLKILIKPDSNDRHTDKLRDIRKFMDTNGITVTQLINFTREVGPNSEIQNLYSMNYKTVN